MKGDDCNCGGEECARQQNRRAHHAPWCNAYDLANGTPRRRYTEPRDQPDPEQARYDRQLEEAYRCSSPEGHNGR